MHVVPLGIRGIGVYRPAGAETAADIAAASGVPEDVIRHKFGLRQKCRATGEGVAEMACRAAQAALDAAGLAPGDLDLVIYHGSQYKDYQPWSAATYIQDRIGAHRAAAFEVYALCAGAPVALRVAAALMRSHPEVRRALLVAATREADLVNYRNPRTRFLYNFADGAAACVVERGWEKNLLLGTAVLSDGRFSLDVVVPPGATCLDVPDPVGMKHRLDPVSLPNFLAVIDAALAQAGLTRLDAGFLAATHMKRSMHQGLLDALGLTWEQTYYLEDWGHLQSADQYIALHEGARLGRLRPGQVAVLAAAGTGYTWAAAALRWG